MKVLDPTLAVALRDRPSTRPVMVQNWVNLAFIHYPVEPEKVQQTLPPGLTVDVFPDSNGVEKAWIGFVPFEIRSLLFARGLKVPTASQFLETNVRTYVHREGREPGVWFYSLDAESRFACQSARTWYGLPYWHAKMRYEESGDHRSYSGRRLAKPSPAYEVELDLGPPLAEPLPGSLEFFLVERYLLYSYFRGRLRTGRVHHTPYRLRSASLARLRQALTGVPGFTVGDPASVLFSHGVEVDVFRLS